MTRRPQLAAALPAIVLVGLALPGSGALAFVCKLHEIQGMTGSIDPR